MSALPQVQPTVAVIGQRAVGGQGCHRPGSRLPARSPTSRPNCPMPPPGSWMTSRSASRTCACRSLIVGRSGPPISLNVHSSRSVGGSGSSPTLSATRPRSSSCSVVKQAMLTPVNQKKSTGWRADQRPIRAPNNSRSNCSGPGCAWNRGHHRRRASARGPAPTANCRNTQRTISASVSLSVRPQRSGSLGPSTAFTTS